MSTQEIAPAIQNKYAEHAALISKLATVDYLPSALQTNEARIDQLKREVKRKRDNVQYLAEKTKAEQDDVNELARSVSKRLFLRVKSGKEGLNKRKIKEENEYVEALQAEKNERTALETLEKELVIAENANFDLKNRTVAANETRARLDELYKELFGGHTKDYPEEDAAEEEVKSYEGAYLVAQKNLNKESQVLALLTKAEKAMKKVLHEMKEAEQIGIRDIASGSHSVNFFDMKELRHAKRHGLEVETFVREATFYEPEVKDLGPLNIPLQDKSTNLNEIDEVRIYQLIGDGSKKAVRYSVHLETEIAASKTRLHALGQIVGEKSSQLNHKRRELEAIRRRIIEDVYHGILPASKEAVWVPCMDDAARGGGGRGPSMDDFTSAGGFANFSGAGAGPAFPFAGGRAIQTTSPDSATTAAGGFRSHQTSGDDGIVVASPTIPECGPIFPEGPAFSAFPVDTIAPAIPGFRVSGDTSKAGDVEPGGFMSPGGGVPWALNPFAAWTLWSASGDEESQKSPITSITMPNANSSLHPEQVPPPPPDPSSPLSVPGGEIAEGPDEQGEVLHRTRGKLFKFNYQRDPQEWEQLAHGEIRLVHDRLQQGGRILLIVGTKTTNVVGDAPTPAGVFSEVFEIPSGLKLSTPVSGGQGTGAERSVVLKLAEMETLALRFVTVDEADAFKEAFGRIGDLLTFPEATSLDLLGGDSNSTDPPPPSMPMGPGDFAMPSIPPGDGKDVSSPNVLVMPSKPRIKKTSPASPTSPTSQHPQTQTQTQSFSMPTEAPPMMPMGPADQQQSQS